MSVTVEVCVETPQSLLAAVEGGADRIELCSALAVGGLTPSHSFIELAASQPVPVYALIRPRDGDFEFTSDEVALMESDIRFCADAGLAGVVIGATRSGGLDISVLSALIGTARPMGVTLHRAFDIVDDPLCAIEDAIALGFDRILTSGGARSAESGAVQIKSYLETASGRISIMAGGGITVENAVTIVQHTGIVEIHGTFSGKIREYHSDFADFGFASTNGLRASDAKIVRMIKQEIDQL